ncbi:OmpA family protein [Vibrio maritimus]|uniref:OmpA family protein n=1 Tax=Vibrio maritimus TaxID=990268 RepID=UPI0040676388
MKIRVSTIAMLACMSVSTSYAQDYYCTNSNLEVKHSISTGSGTVLAQYREGALQKEQVIESSQLASTPHLSATKAVSLDGCQSYVVTDSNHQTNLARVQFGFDQSSLTPMARDSLHTLARSIGQNGTQILVEGHTDSMGSAGYNQELGLKRALSVYDLLRYQGVDKQNITVRTLGETQPLEPNNSSKNRAINRRAEIMVVTGN